MKHTVPSMIKASVGAAGVHSDALVSSIDVADVDAAIDCALKAARRQPPESSDKRILHAARSRDFVAALGDQLGALHAEEPDVRVFTKHDERNRGEFGMNELLYDVTVCRTASVDSTAQGKRLHYVQAPIWHVESELAKDSRQALFDFNKLVLGAAPLNLFVGPIVHDVESFLDVLRTPASCCQGRVFAALIPHPREWDQVRQPVQCEELK